MAIDYTKRRIITTEDGSSSLQLTEVSEQYHSIHGAINESRHIYIEQGLHYFPKDKDIRILEVGFGTGLNALLTLAEQRCGQVEYITIEPFPLSINEVQELNYPTLINCDLKENFIKMHQVKSSEKIILSPHFLFCKWHKTLEEIILPQNYFDLVYFDLFGPDIEPALWCENNFRKIANAMRSKGVLVTYCAKGVVKRTLKSVGFQIESLPGPIGKREITRAILN